MAAPAAASANGYKVAAERDSAGNPIPGGREMDASEAETVRRIFREYAAGLSPRQIARRLNGASPALVDGHGAIPPSAVTRYAAPACCTMNSTSAG